ncbi:cation:proton antiporter [Nannocystis bainbridge]|uniref:Cation:proton antiporter n=1 Tax=Nannocystis bainbridge TaxID=2995303 RepID=A0ABT5E7F9_9BACT|nr:cation:proton antiporter [Nannocystis bainbridge]MDC0721812.1 cation:proton antiporter [Nannocystis bainbridge]
MAPVTVFLVAIACLLAAAAAVRPLALRTNVPEAAWLIVLGVVLRATGLVPPATIAALAPFFAAIAVIIVLFEAGRDMVFGAASEQVVRARKLALAGAALVVPLVALFSQALSGLHLLPVWSWTHAFMLGALMLCTAPEVFAPTLYRRAHPGLVAALEREAALTGALAIAATAFCIDLLSLRVPVGKAYAAIAAGFGLGLAFGAFAGLLWITAIRRVGPGRGVYPYTLAAILALYVVTDTLGGIGALAVLVFGAVVSNAGPLVGALFRPRGTIVEAADEDFRSALDDHARTVEITRVLLFTYLGMNLGPPWGLLAMGIVLGLLLVVLRLLAARLVLRGVDERTFSALALGWPRGMLVAGLAALPHAAAVPGTESLVTLVFAAVATTCVAFGVAVSPLGHAHVSEDMSEGKGASGHGEKDMSVGTGASGHGGKDMSAGPARMVARAPTVDEVLGVKPGSGVVLAGAVLGAADVASEAPVEVTRLPAGEGERMVAVPPSSPGERVDAWTGPDGKTLPPEEPVVPEGPVVTGMTVVPEGPVVTGMTVVPDGPVLGGTTLLPGESGSGRRGLFAVDMPSGGRTPGDLLLAPRTLLPGESGSGRVAEVPRFAPPGAPRSAERTVLRGSGPGAPELVRHVFISAPAGTTVTHESNVAPLVTPKVEAPGELPTRAFEPKVEAPGVLPTRMGESSPGVRAAEASRASDEAPVIQVTESTPTEPSRLEEPQASPGLEVAVTFVPDAPEVVKPEVPAPRPSDDPPLLDLVSEAILPSGHALTHLLDDKGEGGTKDG